MNFHFQSMKPVMQAEFDEIFQHYPTDMSAIIARVPVGGDPYVRKLATVEAIAELAPVHVIVYGSYNPKIFNQYEKYTKFHHLPDWTTYVHNRKRVV